MVKIVDVHTPTASFSIPHSLQQETLSTLFDRLSRKSNTGAAGARVGPGWLKYEYNGCLWNLDDDQDYAIFVWRNPSSSVDSTPTLFMHQPNTPLPSADEYQNPSYHAFRPHKTRMSSHVVHHHSSTSRGASPDRLTNKDGVVQSHFESKQYLAVAPSTRSVHSKKSAKSAKSAKSKASKAESDTRHIDVHSPDYVPKHKIAFAQFHGANGVRTVVGSIGPVSNVRMLLKIGYRHVYMSRAFARLHNFIPKDAAPGWYGYSGLVSIGTWPVKLGSKTTTHQVFLSEEAHFDVVLGRSFFDKRGIITDKMDPTSVTCSDVGEKIDCEVIVIRDGRGEVVTVT
jgi:hypothetical protein